MNVAGIDVGLTLVHRTSGICRTGAAGEVLTHTYIDRRSRTEALGGARRLQILAIDAPVLPDGDLHYTSRACEKVFVWGAFQKRCKCGESQVSGTGQALRRAGLDTAYDFADSAPATDVRRPFPRVLPEHNVIEAFPNAFLGVMLPEEAFAPNTSRNDKFDRLYEYWVESRSWEGLRGNVQWERPGFWEHVVRNKHHDERAAIVCALTAICVLRGEYVAVGDVAGGYFFLPPWPLWAPWARDALAVNRRDQRLPAPVDVWLDGTCFRQADPLPDIGLARKAGNHDLPG
jgi:hypothetical protein